MKKTVNFLLIAFLIFYVVTKPDQAAHVMRTIGQWLKDIAIGLGSFITSLA